MKRCRNCGRMNEETALRCSNCGYKLPKIVSHYEPSSATAYTTAFNELVNKFYDNPDNKMTKNELLDDNLKDDDIRSLIDWGYLTYQGGQYRLTDRGKETYFMSPRYKKRKSEDENE